MRRRLWNNNDGDGRSGLLLLLAVLLASCAQTPAGGRPALDAATPPPAPDVAAPAVDASVPLPVDAAPALTPDAAPTPDLAPPADAAAPLVDVAVPQDSQPPRDRAPDLTADVNPPAPMAPGLYFLLRVGGAQVTLPATVNGIVVEQAVLLLHELYLASDVGGSYVTARPADFSGSGVVKLALPALGPGLYSRLQIKLEAESEGGGLPPVLQGRAASIYVSGKTASGASFVIRDTGENETGVAASTPRDLRAGDPLRAIVSYDLERWFTGVNLTGAGPIEIDSSKNSDQLPRFRTNLMQSATLVLE